MALEVPPDDNAFHVVCQDIFRNAHEQERMYHSDEQILLALVHIKRATGRIILVTLL